MTQGDVLTAGALRQLDAFRAAMDRELAELNYRLDALRARMDRPAEAPQAELDH